MVAFLPVSLFDLLVMFLVKQCIFISVANVWFRILEAYSMVAFYIQEMVPFGESWHASQ
jgi:hypothetical protein